MEWPKNLRKPKPCSDRAARPVLVGRAVGRSFRPAWKRRVSLWLPRRLRAREFEMRRFVLSFNADLGRLESTQNRL